MAKRTCLTIESQLNFYTRFQTQTVPKPYPLGVGAHAYMAYIRECPRETGSGFGERGGAPPPRILRSSPREV